MAVITGGSVGIGLAVAQGLAQEGVHLVLGARDEARVVAQAQSLATTYNVRTLGVKVDVSKEDELVRFVSEIDQTFGGADILINNAGTGSEETILNAPDDKWQYYWELHVMAAIRLSRSLTPFMQQRGGGVIINNGSICATQPLGYEPIYNVTKTALAMFSKCLANELIKYNIRVNTINPGLVLTPDWQKTAKQLTAGNKPGITWKEYLDNIAKENAPIGRFATPVER